MFADLDGKEVWLELIKFADVNVASVVFAGPDWYALITGVNAYAPPRAP